MRWNCFISRTGEVPSLSHPGRGQDFALRPFQASDFLQFGTPALHAGTDSKMLEQLQPTWLAWTAKWSFNLHPPFGGKYSWSPVIGMD